MYICVCGSLFLYQINQIHLTCLITFAINTTMIGISNRLKLFSKRWRNLTLDNPILPNFRDTFFPVFQILCNKQQFTTFFKPKIIPSKMLS